MNADIQKIIEVADRGYGNGVLLAHAQYRQDQDDELAKFIINWLESEAEIESPETFENPYAEQLFDAILVISYIKDKIRDVLGALQDEYVRLSKNEVPDEISRKVLGIIPDLMDLPKDYRKGVRGMIKRRGGLD